MSSTAKPISAVAALHGGHVHHDELIALGLGRHAVAHRVSRGLLIPVYYRVYAVGHLPTNPIDRAKGALLAAGPRSALGDISAGSYYAIYDRWRYPLHVTVPTDRRIKGLVIHRNRHLLKRDILTPEPGLRIISPALALLQNAPHLSETRLRRVVNELRLKHDIKLTELEGLARRFPRHPGAKALNRIVSSSQPEPNRSPWEDEWPAFAARHGLPPYVMNEHVAGHRVDILFPEERLIVELDGWASHQTHEAFIRDRAQDAEILAQTGMPTVRITHGRFHRQTRAEARRLQAILEQRRG